MKRSGYGINIVTSQPDFVVRALMETMKNETGERLIDGYESSEFELENVDGDLVFTGNVSKLICDADSKYQAAQRISRQGEKRVVFALGNDDPDYGMFIQADFPIKVVSDDDEDVPPKESKYSDAYGKIVSKNLNDVGGTIQKTLAGELFENVTPSTKLKYYAL